STSVGPHLDDLVITFDGASARERASQGQHRALVLALKLAEISHLADALGEPPMLLLDDMSSELDEGRSRQLFEAVRGLDGQVIMTSTETPKRIGDRLKTASNISIYGVDGGRLSAVQL
ncbi:MAG: DNA replication and repair protein RecF, partial [Myxococcota bacterium]